MELEKDKIHERLQEYQEEEKYNQSASDLPTLHNGWSVTMQNWQTGIWGKKKKIFINSSVLSSYIDHALSHCNTCSG